jgi:hypothetical protein
MYFRIAFIEIFSAESTFLSRKKENICIARKHDILQTEGYNFLFFVIQFVRGPPVDKDGFLLEARAGPLLRRCRRGLSARPLGFPFQQDPRDAKLGWNRELPRGRYLLPRLSAVRRENNNNRL